MKIKIGAYSVRPYHYSIDLIRILLERIFLHGEHVCNDWKPVRYQAK